MMSCYKGIGGITTKLESKHAEKDLFESCKLKARRRNTSKGKLVRLQGTPTRAK